MTFDRGRGADDSVSVCILYGRSGGEVGTSRIFVDRPFEDSLLVSGLHHITRQRYADVQYKLRLRDCEN